MAFSRAKSLKKTGISPKTCPFTTNALTNAQKYSTITDSFKKRNKKLTSILLALEASRLNGMAEDFGHGNLPVIFFAQAPGRWNFS
jgi:hypothetical protein